MRDGDAARLEPCCAMRSECVVPTVVPTDRLESGHCVIVPDGAVPGRRALPESESPLTAILSEIASGGRCYVRGVTTEGRAARTRDGVRAALPLVLGPVLFGISFGVLAEAAGMSVAAAVVMSATAFAGSAQFAAASVLEDGGTALAAIVSAVLLNLRYAGMSIATASIFSGGRARRFFESQLIVDESWALSGRSGRFEWPILVGAGLLLYVLWVSSTAVGSVVGTALGNPNDLGLDAAFAALFLALAIPYLRERKAAQAALAAAAITLLLLPVAPAGVPLVVASAACLLGLRR